MYHYATLDPRNTPDNDHVLGDGSTVLGIEVTVPALATRCGLGNCDPQHLGGDAGTAAIEAALEWPLPPRGATLATVRTDADALGAMAVLTLRAQGVDLAEVGDSRMLERVSAIAAADKEATGPWPGRLRVGSASALARLDGTGAGEAVAVIADRVMDCTHPLARRVGHMHHWLRVGEVPGGEEIRGRLLDEAQEALAELTVLPDEAVDSVILVQGSHRLALSLGYHYGPVVVAFNPAFRFQGGEPHRKFTIARWNSAVPMAWDRLREQLQQREPGWGGSSSIMGSPQGVSSGLMPDEVMDLAVGAVYHAD